MSLQGLAQHAPCHKGPYRPEDNSEVYVAEILAAEKPGDARAESFQGGSFVHLEKVENPAPLPQSGRKGAGQGG